MDGARFSLLDAEKQHRPRLFFDAVAGRSYNWAVRVHCHSNEYNIARYGEIIVTDHQHQEKLRIPLRCYHGGESHVVVLAPTAAGLDFGVIEPPSSITKEIVVVNTGTAPAFVKVLIKSNQEQSPFSLFVEPTSLLLNPNEHRSCIVKITCAVAGMAMANEEPPQQWTLDILHVDQVLRERTLHNEHSPFLEDDRAVLSQSVRVHRLDVLATLGTTRVSAKSIATSAWYVTPRQLIVGPKDTTPPGWTVLLTNTSDEEIKFEAAWPAAHVDVTPAIGRVPANAGRKLYVTPLNLAGRKQDWNGMITISDSKTTQHITLNIAAALPSTTKSRHEDVVVRTVTLDFPATLVGSSSQRRAVVENRSAGPVTIKAAVAGDGFSLLSEEQQVMIVESGSTAQIPIVFTPTQSGRFDGEAKLIMGERKETCYLFGVGHITGLSPSLPKVVLPDGNGLLRVDRQEIDFGVVHGGEPIHQSIKVLNYAPQHCRVLVCGLRQDDSLFRIAEEHQLITLSKKQYVRLPITLTPPSRWSASLSNVERVIMFVSDADSMPVRVRLKAQFVAQS